MTPLDRLLEAERAQLAGTTNKEEIPEMITTTDRIGFDTVEDGLRWLRPQREPAHVDAGVARHLKVCGDVDEEGIRSLTVTTGGGFAPAETAAVMAALRTYDVRVSVVDGAPALVARDGDDEELAAS